MLNVFGFPEIFCGQVTVSRVSIRLSLCQDILFLAIVSFAQFAVIDHGINSFSHSLSP